MLIKYTYPIKGQIFLPEHWPVKWDKYRIDWTVQDGLAQTVTLSVKADDLSGLPTIVPLSQPGVAANITLGHDPYHDEAETILRTARGLLGFFMNAEIDFARPKIEWEPETEDERNVLKLYSFSVEDREKDDPHSVGYDLIARCFLAAIPARDFDVPLSFLAKGQKDIGTKRFIDAYYSFFFFLETQFAPGYSDPKKVSARFKATDEIRHAMSDARGLFAEFPPQNGKGARLLQLSDEELLEHLVAVRGTLHHHALRRKQGSWHPERHDQYEPEALFLQYLVRAVAQGQSMPIMFDESITKDLIEGAKLEAATIVYVVNAIGGADRMGTFGLPQIRSTSIGRKPSHTHLAIIEEQLRAEEAPYRLAAVRRYEITNEDGSVVFAHYKNNTFPR